MIERINDILRVYTGERVYHQYKTLVDPKTHKESHEHLICRVYDKQAKVKETDFKRNIDRLA